MIFFLNLEFTRKAVTSMTSPLVRRSAYKQQEVLMIIKDDTTLMILLTKVNLFPKGVLRHFTRSPLQSALDATSPSRISIGT